MQVYSYSKDINRRMYFIIISAKVHVTQHSESTLTDTHVHLFNLLTYLMIVFIEIFSPKIVLFTINLIQGLSWRWSYGTDIYLYNQCLSPQKMPVKLHIWWGVVHLLILLYVIKFIIDCKKNMWTSQESLVRPVVSDKKIKVHILCGKDCK